MTKHSEFEGDAAGRCGGCGSRNMLTASDGKHSICLKCRRLQEPEHRDWPLAQMCDNCAFRKGSPERADPYRWAEMQETLEKGQYFYCHKGLTVTLSEDRETATFDAPDPKDGKVCAGWLAAYVAQLKRSA